MDEETASSVFRLLCVSGEGRNRRNCKKTDALLAAALLLCVL